MRAVIGAGSSVLAGQVLIHSGCRRTPLGDRPHHERLAAASVARDKDAVLAGGEPLVCGQSLPET